MNRNDNRSHEEAPSPVDWTIAQALSEMDGDLEVPEDFRTSWRAAVEKEARQMKEKKRYSPRISRTLWRVGAAAAAVVFLVTGTVLTRNAARRAASTSAYDGAYEAETSYSRSATDNGVYMAADSVAYMPQPQNAMAAYDEAADTGVSQTEQKSVVLRTATVSLNTTAFDDDVASLKSLLARYQGWAEYESTSGEAVASSGGGRRASLTLRVPSGSLDDFLTGVRGIGTVKSLETTAEDVSSNYYDVAARLSIYQAQRDRLKELLADAKDMSDILEIENSLTDLQYRIESLQGSLNHWDSYAATSVVNVSVKEIAVKADKVESGLLERLGDAFGESFREAGAFFSDLLVFLVLALPYLLALCVLTALIAFGVRRRRVRREHRAAEKSEE